MSEILLEARGITKSFEKSGASIGVLQGVDIEVRRGESVAIMGSSGAGKSTLLHILGTLDRPDHGDILFGPERKPLLKMKDRELSHFRNRELGFVFQFHYLLPEFTALENVMMPAQIAGFSDATAREHAQELLDFVGLKHRLQHRPFELSGGEQQRVAIARAILLRPKLLLADELTGNLDSANTEGVLELLRKLHQATGVSILVVTHDPAVAQRMDRTVMMRDGRIVSQSY